MLPIALIMVRLVEHGGILSLPALLLLRCHALDRWGDRRIWRASAHEFGAGLEPANWW